MEPEVSFQHGAEVLGHVGHAGMKSCHQARVEGQKIQPAGGERVSSVHNGDSTPWWSFKHTHAHAHTHPHPHTHSRLFRLNPTHTTLTVLIRAPNVDSSANENSPPRTHGTVSSCFKETTENAGNTTSVHNDQLKGRAAGKKSPQKKQIYKRL